MTQQTAQSGRLSNDYIRELMVLGPFEGIDATTAPIYVDQNHAVDATNVVPDRAYLGYVTAQGRTDLGVTGLPATDPNALIKCLDATGVYYLAYYPAPTSAIYFFRPGGAASSLSLPSGATITGPGNFTQGRYWTFLATNAIGDTPLKIKYDTHVVTNWGIVPPAGALTSAAGAAGVLNFPAYQWRVTFGVTAGGVSVQESSPGPSSVALALTNQKGTLTAIPASTDTQVNQRNLYRLDSGGAYRLVGTINDNTTTTFTDNTADAAVVGQNLILNRDVPLPFIATMYHKDYLFGFGYPSANPSTSSDALWSNATEPWGFNIATQFLPVSENLGNDVAVASLSLSALGFLIKQRTAHAVFGDSSNDFYIQKLFDIGCIAPKSAIVAQGVAFWLSGEGVFAFDGSSAPQYLSAKIKSYLEANLAALATAVGSYKDRCYYLSFPNASVPVTWQYDTIRQEWWKLGWATDVAYFDPDDVSVTPGAIIAGSLTGLMYQWFNAETDLGQPITSTYLSRISDSGMPEATKKYRQLAILAPAQNAVATVMITADPGPNQKQATRTVSLLTTTSQAQIISIPPGIEGREVQVQLSITSSSEVQIQKVALYGWVKRRLAPQG